MQMDDGQEVNGKMKALNKEQMQEIKTLRGRLQEQLHKVAESQTVHEILKDEVERVKRESAVYNERRKESRMKVVALEVHSLENSCFSVSP